MKPLFRRAFCLLLALVILVIAAFLFRDTIAREFVEYQIKNQTGFPARIGRLHAGLLDSELRIENLVICNPAAFGGGTFIDMPELLVEYDGGALRAGKLHCKLVRFNLAQVNLVEDAQGGHNFELLQKRFKGPIAPGNPAAKKSAPGGRRSKVDFAGIETLDLTLGKATFRRMKQPGKIDEFRLNVNHQVFTDILSENDFPGVLLVALLRSDVNFIQNAKAQSWLQLLAPPQK
jgi:hypothetical protein